MKLVITMKNGEAISIFSTHFRIKPGVLIITDLDGNVHTLRLKDIEVFSQNT